MSRSPVLPDGLVYAKTPRLRLLCKVPCVFSFSLLPSNGKNKITTIIIETSGERDWGGGEGVRLENGGSVSRSKTIFYLFGRRKHLRRPTIFSFRFSWKHNPYGIKPIDSILQSSHWATTFHRYGFIAYTLRIHITDDQSRRFGTGNFRARRPCVTPVSKRISRTTAL